MRRCALLFCSVFLFFLTAHGALASSPTFISGTITADTLWVESNSPYVFDGDVTIQSGSHLTIQPGVEVRMQGHTLQVGGNFTAEGTASKRIRFTDAVKITFRSSQYEPVVITYADFSMLLAIDQSFGSSFSLADFNFSSNTAKTVQLFTIGTIDRFLFLNNSLDSLEYHNLVPMTSRQIQVVNNTFSSLAQLHFIITSDANLPSVIQQNLFTLRSGSSYGMDIVVDNTSSQFFDLSQVQTRLGNIDNISVLDLKGKIRLADSYLYKFQSINFRGEVSANNIVVTGSVGNAIVLSGNNNTVSNSVISGNGVGVAALDLGTGNTLSHSNLFNNGYNAKISCSGCGDILATNNWWGTSSDAVIQTSIYDKKDNAAMGEVIYSPYLMSAESAVPSLTPVASPTIAWNATATSTVNPFSTYVPTSTAIPYPTNSMYSCTTSEADKLAAYVINPSDIQNFDVWNYTWMLYQKLLLRTASNSEVQSWVDSNKTKLQIQQMMTGSQEFLGSTCPQLRQRLKDATFPDTTKSLTNFYAQNYQAQWVAQYKPSEYEGGSNDGDEYFDVTRCAEVPFWVEMNNTGTRPWLSAKNPLANETNQISFSTYKDKNVKSAPSSTGFDSCPTNQNCGKSYFFHNSWVSQYRIGTLDNLLVNPNESGRVSMTFKIPCDAELGRYREDISAASGRYWIYNFMNGDPLSVMHIWVGFDING